MLWYWSGRNKSNINSKKLIYYKFMKTFIGGIGCFWDEKKYEGIDGIISTECGIVEGMNQM